MIVTPTVRSRHRPSETAARSSPVIRTLLRFAMHSSMLLVCRKAAAPGVSIQRRGAPDQLIFSIIRSGRPISRAAMRVWGRSAQFLTDRRSDIVRNVDSNELQRNSLCFRRSAVTYSVSQVALWGLSDVILHPSARSTDSKRRFSVVDQARETTQIR